MEPAVKEEKEEQEQFSNMSPDEVKRMKNTEAARRSRARKLEKINSLDNQVAKLSNENSQLKTRLAVFSTEKQVWKSKEDEYKYRIEVLEKQLLDAHSVLFDINSK